jgi:hypothetical protein
MLMIIVLSTFPAFAMEHSFCLGAHYFYALEDIKSEWDNTSVGDAFHRDGLAISVGYLVKPNEHFGLLFELQDFPSGYYDAKNAYSPRILFLLGQSFYVGGGVAWNHVSWENATHDLHDSSAWSDTYYLLRAGLEIPLIVEDLKLGINADYDFNQWNDVSGFDSDTLTFGAYLKVTL